MKRDCSLATQPLVRRLITGIPDIMVPVRGSNNILFVS